LYQGAAAKDNISIKGKERKGYLSIIEICFSSIVKRNEERSGGVSGHGSFKLKTRVGARFAQISGRW
jgi:hypothetical protein